MINYKFKKGDRVRLTKMYRGDLRTGSVGVVAEDDDLPYVAFEGFTGGRMEALNEHPICQDDLELIEPSVDTFKIGQRVRVSNRLTTFEGAEGQVVSGNYASHVAVVLDADHLPLRYFFAHELTSIEQAPTSPAKPECYVTAWVEEGDFHLTGDVLVTKQDADASANLLVGCRPGREVAVLKLVSKHSSAVTVTSEDV